MARKITRYKVSDLQYSTIMKDFVRYAENGLFIYIYRWLPNMRRDNRFITAMQNKWYHKPFSLN